MSNKGNIISWAALLVGVVAVALIAWNMTATTKTGYVLIGQVFEAFDMKKELEGNYTKAKNTTQKLLDSLQFELQLMAGKLETQKNPVKEEVMNFEMKRQEFLTRKQKFEEDIQRMKEEYDSQILGRIDEYVQQYGKENGYTYIFGNDGNGSLMYAKDAENVTEAVILYINEKYRGGTPAK